MRVARWRWVLVPMIVVVAGCLPRPATVSVPASTDAYLATNGLAFEAGTWKNTGLSGADVAAALRNDPTTLMFQTRAVPVFGSLRCTGAVMPCEPTEAVWVIVYPDWVGADGTGWAEVDAIAGLDAGYSFVDPREP